MYPLALRFLLSFSLCPLPEDSCQPLTAGAWVKSQSSACEIYGGQNGTGSVFSKYIGVLLFDFILFYFSLF